MGGVPALPAPPTPPRMPVPDDAAATAAKRKAQMDLMGMQGRDSTNLSQNGSDRGGSFVSDVLGNSK